MLSIQTSKNTGNITSSYKAALKNLNISEEAKECLQQALKEMGDSSKLQQPDIEAGKNTGNVIRGHKATLTNLRVSKEAKEHSYTVLKDNQAL
ncbi:uncharacterized protein FOMMEDRAFT_91766 [Fomitiporia mediterranea MF3/22]|uniref:uncharacterized protein n=1 Tax=Fomitiporia mediterranea (strain MF3/22) TaxID=694068 RepID=UPI0004407773|nr:uncharacterized protein FOMMEDRAFT_91766 [Fomitiporia mediterranea MF3/22]EJD00167.1 hypothetical protein FOMMEDRAFT_91766 [Fomitiporia mediterranea MF3/22]